MNREVTMELLEKYGKEFVQDRANRVAQNAVVGKGVNAAATDSSVEREIANTFSMHQKQVITRKYGRLFCLHWHLLEQLQE